jgi:hypothetical protein
MRLPVSLLSLSPEKVEYQTAPAKQKNKLRYHAAALLRGGKLSRWFLAQAWRFEMF